jgi:TrmH family RNA methyltransferase
VTGAQQPLSLRNPKVQHLRRLLGRRRSRTEAGQFAFEGATLLGEALRAAVDVDAVFFDAAAAPAMEDALHDLGDDARPPTHPLADGVAERIADVTTSQGVFAVAPLPTARIDDVEPASTAGMIVVLDGINDPGNAGTIVRTAEAVGATAVVFASQSTDPFGPKVLRAAAGSSFRMSTVVAGPTVEVLGALRARGWRALGTVASGGADHRAVDLTGAVAMVVGSEAHGIEADVAAALDERVTIPMRGRLESLNVAVAAAVLGYERIRQTDAADA